MKKFLGLILLVLWLAPNGAAEIALDPAWEKYVIAQKKLQNAIHYHMKLSARDVQKSLDNSQRLQLDLVDQRTMKFYYLVESNPERLMRDQGFSAFVNFQWRPEDERVLLETNKAYRKLNEKIQEMKEKVQEDASMRIVEQKLASFKKTIKYKEVLARFRFVSKEVEDILASEKTVFKLS